MYPNYDVKTNLQMSWTAVTLLYMYNMNIVHGMGLLRYTEV